MDDVFQTASCMPGYLKLQHNPQLNKESYDKGPTNLHKNLVFFRYSKIFVNQYFIKYLLSSHDTLHCIRGYKNSTKDLKIDLYKWVQRHKKVQRHLQWFKNAY